MSVLNLGITGNVQPQEIATFINSGADEVLTKPVSQKKFTSVLSSYLERDQETRQEEGI
jgi:CheY-like chemotaxis protein